MLQQTARKLYATLMIFPNNATAISKEKKMKHSNRKKKDISDLTKKIEKLNTELLKTELDFIRAGKSKFLLFRM